MITVLPWSGIPTIKPPPGGNVIGSGVPAGKVSAGTGTMVPAGSAVATTIGGMVGYCGVGVAGRDVGGLPNACPVIDAQPVRANTMITARIRSLWFFMSVPTFNG
jgi:hypothetical protein